MFPDTRLNLCDIIITAKEITENVGFADIDRTCEIMPLFRSKKECGVENDIDARTQYPGQTIRAFLLPATDIAIVFQIFSERFRKFIGNG